MRAELSSLAGSILRFALEGRVPYATCAGELMIVSTFNVVRTVFLGLDGWVFAICSHCFSKVIRWRSSARRSFSRRFCSAVTVLAFPGLLRRIGLLRGGQGPDENQDGEDGEDLKGQGEGESGTKPIRKPSFGIDDVGVFAVIGV